MNKSNGDDDAGLFLGHFYDPDTGTTYDNSTAQTAKSRLVKYYSKAVTEYNSGNTAQAMNYLAFALHYAADLSMPHHAANKTALNSNHLTFETYAKNHQNNYVETTLPSSSFTWAKNTYM